jgi:hypothetical protein
LNHRDIRVENFIAYKRWSDRRTVYALIDFEHCAREGASPPVRTLVGWETGTLDNGVYNSRSDLFQLGRMLRQIAAESHIQQSRAMQQFLKELTSKQRTAAELLQDPWLSCACDGGDDSQMSE